MSFIQVTKEEFNTHAQQVSERSFMQTEEMAKLLEKRGFSISYVAWKEGNQIEVSAIVYSMPMTGGLRMEVNCGPIHSSVAHLSDFYQCLKDYAKANGALELVIKPYDTYQIFDSNGEPISSEQKQLISQLTDLGYSFDGLQTGYPGGEPDWHYVKELSGIEEKDLIKSFSKKGKPLVKKAKTFGIKLKKLRARIVKLQADLETNPKSEKKQNQLRELSSQLETFDVRKGEATAFIDKYGQEDIVLAGSLFVYTPQEAVYLFSGSYPEFNKFYAPALLQEYVMTQAIKRGIGFYNFLGIMGIFDGSDGVLRFKQNFNGYIVRKMGTFRYYPQPLKYKAIQGVKKLLGRN